MTTHDEYLARAIAELRAEDPRGWGLAADKTIANTIRVRWMVLGYAITDLATLIIPRRFRRPR